jgi:hypothetical protein
MGKLVNPVDLKSTAERLPGSTPGTRTKYDSKNSNFKIQGKQIFPARRNR